MSKAPPSLSVCLDASKPPQVHYLTSALEGIIVKVSPPTPATDRLALSLTEADPLGSGKLTQFARTSWEAVVEAALMCAMARLEASLEDARRVMKRMSKAARKLKGEAKAAAKVEIASLQEQMDGVEADIERGDVDADKNIVRQVDFDRVLYRLKASDIEAWAACREYMAHDELNAEWRIASALQGLFTQDGLTESGEPNLTPLAAWSQCAFDSPTSVLAHLRGIENPKLRRAMFEQLRDILSDKAVDPEGKALCASPPGTTEGTAEAPTTAPTAQAS